MAKDKEEEVNLLKAEIADLRSRVRDLSEDEKRLSNASAAQQLVIRKLELHRDALLSALHNNQQMAERFLKDPSERAKYGRS